MQRNILSVSVFAVLGLFTTPGCRPSSGSATVPKASRATALTRCNAIDYHGPLRMFSSEGEVKNAGVIENYRQRHAIPAGTEALAYERPENVYSNHSERICVAPGAGANADIIIMRQQDTGTLTRGTPQASVDDLYGGARDFLSMRGQLLDMTESVTKLERVDEQNYRLRESFHVRAVSEHDRIRLPYTFMANRVHVGAYPYALRAGVVPNVPAGDTLLVREGFMALR